MSIQDNYLIRTFDRLPSTNDYAQALWAESPPDRTVIRAMDQFAGKGQKGNHWHSEPGSNLTCSVMLRLDMPVDQMFSLSKIAALSLRETAKAYVPHAEVLVKWPNDLLINGRKAGGILIENQIEGPRVRSAILGLGLNVNQQIFPPELSHKGTSLRKEAGRDLPLEAVFDHMLTSLDTHLSWLKTGQIDRIDRAYREHLYGYQSELFVEIDGQISQRLLVGVDKFGRLALAQDDQLRYFDIKEVRLLLPFEPS